MIESGFADRMLLGDSQNPVSGADFAALSKAGAATLAGRPSVVYVGENHPLLPVALFASAWVGAPFVPVNYRLEDAHLNQLVDRQPGAVVLADEASASRITGDHEVVILDDWLASIDRSVDIADPPFDDDEVAVVLFTSGTTSEPKSALLRHRHLMAYLLGSVEFGSADEDEAVLVSVPPYHVAGVANMLSNLFAGRRLVYLDHFAPERWLELVRSEGVTNAMVVPTMLARVVTSLAGAPANVPTLRTLSYGGAKLSERVLREALDLFPNTGFVNAYGLTETASTIAVLGPEDHRAAVTSDDPEVQRRLSSAGQVLPMVEIEIRDDNDEALPAGETGTIFLRGEQISGEYASGSLLDEQGWFCTRDRGYVDSGGYLFIEGRSDDTIIRGGENIAPAEIEEVIAAIPWVEDVCVVGVTDDEWGQEIAAAVVAKPGEKHTADEIQQAVRDNLRGSKTPRLVEFADELPRTDTGKLLRRVVKTDIFHD